MQNWSKVFFDAVKHSYKKETERIVMLSSNISQKTLEDIKAHRKHIRILTEASNIYYTNGSGGSLKRRTSIHDLDDVLE